MRPLMTLLKREWLEWQRVIIGTILIITFLNILMLIGAVRGSNFFHQKLSEDGHILLEDLQFNDQEEIDIDIRLNGNDVEVTLDGKNAPQSMENLLSEVAVPVIYGFRIGMMAIFAFVLFLSLFYFSDAIYKERADNSTLFYRSLPLSDHLIIGSKIGAGLLAVIGLTLFLSLEYILFMRLNIWIMGQPFSYLAGLVFSQISYVRMIWGWFGYLIFAALHMAPLALFLMLVGTYVKGRPLLIGIGAPILFSVSWAILFQNAAFLRFIGEFFWGFNKIVIDQWNMVEQGMGSPNMAYGNFWGYIFNMDTAISILVSALLYYGIWHTYRKNIPTG